MAGSGVAGSDVAGTGVGGPGRPPQTRLVADRGLVFLDELLQFRYLSSDPRQRYLYILGVDETLQPLDYFPRPLGASQSVTIRPTLAMEPVGRSIRLATRHYAGQLWIFALFSPRPLLRRDVHAVLQRLRIRGVRVELLDKIDWGKDVVPVVRRFQVRNAT